MVGRLFRPKDAIIRYRINKEKTAWQHPNRCTSARHQPAAIYTTLIEVIGKEKFRKAPFLKICRKIGNVLSAARGKRCLSLWRDRDRFRNHNILIIESKEVSIYGPEG